MDQYCSLILLFLFNPIVTSMRELKQVSELKKVQRKLGCQRVSLGSLSEATQVFEPERLQAIVEQLLGQIEVLPHDSRLDQLKQALVAVDGTLLKRLPQITQTAWQSRRHPDGWRLHTQFEILRGVPRRMDLTDGVGTLGSPRSKRIEHAPPSSIIMFAHLLSHDPVGIEIQTYCVIIACLLISLTTGRKPTLQTYEMICFYFTGLADEEELVAHIARLKPIDA